MDDPKIVFASHPYRKRVCFEYNLLKAQPGLTVSLIPSNEQGIAGFHIITNVDQHLKLPILDEYPFLHYLQFVNGGEHPHAPARHIVDYVLAEATRQKLFDTIKRNH